MNRQDFVAGAQNAPALGPVSPPGVHIRYYPPALALRDAITGYNGYGVIDPAEAVDWFLPAPAMLCVAVDAGPIAATIRNRRIDPVDPVSVYGPTSFALRMTTHGGVNIGIGLSAIGWARLMRTDASDVHNRVVPLATLGHAPLAEALRVGLSGAAGDDAIPAILDAILTPLLAVPHRDESAIAALSRVVADGVLTDVDAVAAQVGVPPHTLRRIALRHFGMPPKRLLCRARFLRAFLMLFRTGQLYADAPTAEGYFDASHFLRDAHAFLGTTPRRFMARATPFLDRSLRVRAAVLGAASQALHPVSPPVVAIRDERTG